MRDKPMVVKVQYPGKGIGEGIIDEISYSEVPTIITGKFKYFTGTISHM